MAVDVAKVSDRAGFARSELAVAERKIAAVREAARRRDFVAANRRLAEAYIDIELAKVRAEAARLRAEVAQRARTKGGPARAAPAGGN